MRDCESGECGGRLWGRPTAAFVHAPTEELSHSCQWLKWWCRSLGTPMNMQIIHVQRSLVSFISKRCVKSLETVGKYDSRGVARIFFGCTHGNHNVNQAIYWLDKMRQSWDNLSQRTLTLTGGLYACASVRTLWLRPWIVVKLDQYHVINTHIPTFSFAKTRARSYVIILFIPYVKKFWSFEIFWKGITTVFTPYTLTYKTPNMIDCDINHTWKDNDIYINVI